MHMHDKAADSWQLPGRRVGGVGGELAAEGRPPQSWTPETAGWLLLSRRPLWVDCNSCLMTHASSPTCAHNRMACCAHD